MRKNAAILVDLEELSALLTDSRKGFELISGRAEDETLKNYFKKCEAESTHMWKELNEEIGALQGNTKDKGTVKGAINHLWMKIKSDMELAGSISLLHDIENCETLNAERYEQVLKHGLPQHIKALLQKQHTALKARVDELKVMREKLEMKEQGA